MLRGRGDCRSKVPTLVNKHKEYTVDKHLPETFPKWIPFEVPVCGRFDRNLVYNFQLRQNNGLET